MMTLSNGCNKDGNDPLRSSPWSFSTMNRRRKYEDREGNEHIVRAMSARVLLSDDVQDSSSFFLLLLLLSRAIAT